jgi:RNA polymerase sigma-70 factor (ECF subfamily)
MDSKQLDDTIHGILAGDTDLYAQIISSYHRDVWRVVDSMLFSRDRTPELVQDVFIAVFQHLDKFELGRNFDYWIREVARNVVRKELRRQSREFRRWDSYREEVLTQMEQGEKWSDLTHRRAEALEKCRKQLPPDCEKGFCLRYADSLSFDQIAQALGRTADGVRMMLGRARLMLRDCIGEKMAEQDCS